MYYINLCSLNEIIKFKLEFEYHNAVDMTTIITLHMKTDVKRPHVSDKKL